MPFIEIIQADITAQRVDAIVNAANSELAHGGGVAAAIARAAGRELEVDSRAAASVPVGQATTTRAGNLPCRYVIHAVGPRWRGGEADEPRLLASAYEAAIAQAIEHNCASVSLPSLSTGIFGFPIERAAPIAIASVGQALVDQDVVRQARFCLFSARDLGIFESAYEQWRTSGR